jgi:hypothetical protein
MARSIAVVLVACACVLGVLVVHNTVVDSEASNPVELYFDWDAPDEVHVSISTLAHRGFGCFDCFQRCCWVASDSVFTLATTAQKMGF